MNRLTDNPESGKLNCGMHSNHPPSKLKTYGFAIAIVLAHLCHLAR